MSEATAPYGAKPVQVPPVQVEIKDAGPKGIEIANRGSCVLSAHSEVSRPDTGVKVKPGAAFFGGAPGGIFLTPLLSQGITEPGDANTLPPAVHQLKSVTDVFMDVWDGRKLAELRYDDRGYKRGDLLVLRELDDMRQVAGNSTSYTGRYLAAEITHVFRCERWMGTGAGDFVVLSIKVLSKGRLP